MARNEQLIRQHKVLQILERVRFGRTLPELQDDVVEELGLSSLHTRTLRRDLEALQAAGIDVDVHDSPRGRVWKLGPRAKQTHKISATATELIALSLGRQLLHPLAGTPFWMGIESFWNKINEEIPPTVISHYEKYRKTLRVLGVPAKSYEKHHGMIKTINRAIVEHRVVEIEYHSLGKAASVREIEPFSILLFQSSLYIIAANHGDDSPIEERFRTFKLDRFEKATILDKWFKAPTDLDIDNFIGDSMGIFFGGKVSKFKIRIQQQAAEWIQEDPWHPEQEIKKLKSGEIELTVKAHPTEIIPRVLALGEQAELISPKSAREHLAHVAKSMAKMYK